MACFKGAADRLTVRKCCDFEPSPTLCRALPNLAKQQAPCTMAALYGDDAVTDESRPDALSLGFIKVENGVSNRRRGKEARHRGDFEPNPPTQD